VWLPRWRLLSLIEVPMMEVGRNDQVKESWPVKASVRSGARKRGARNVAAGNTVHHACTYNEGERQALRAENACIASGRGRG
jgi:hypothetical protein